MNKLLVVCGPTATGKTPLAVKLAKKLGGEIISADSRQVYKGMDIGTGKDLPVNIKCQMSTHSTSSGLMLSEVEASNVKCFGKRICYYTINGVKIWGYDLMEPTEEFSVAQYVEIANKIIKDIWSRRKLPILVGGTGLYIKAVVNGIPTVEIPKNLSLRQQYKRKSVVELQEILGSLDPFKQASMNASDRKNPRRLVRAIEISESGIKNLESGIKIIDSVLFIGLTAPKNYLDTKIEERVEKRVKNGIEKEIRELFQIGVTWGHQSMQALGYRQWEGYFRKFGGDSGWEKENTETLNDFEGTERRTAINDWKQAEKQYAKRQMTWFKRDKRINWFDISRAGWKDSVEKIVRKWHNQDNPKIRDKQSLALQDKRSLALQAQKSIHSASSGLY